MVSLPQVNFQKAWEQHREEFCRLVQIPSVYDEATVCPETPYGAPIGAAMEYMRSLCRREGFAIREYEGGAFSASWGEGERVDIASHLDVVGVTDDWAEDPFSGSVRDGFVYGRGTQDMKSGAFLSFLALKLVKDSGIRPNREIRLVYGTDEERTMDDMRRYVELAGLPAFAFSPDGHFPMVIGEKGALMWTLEGDCPTFVRTLEAGIQPNVIPPFARCVVSADPAKVREIADRLGIRAELREVAEGLEIACSGKAAHASRPEDGHSALSDLLRLLGAVSGEETLVRLAKTFGDPYGVGAGIACDIAPMGKLSMNLGKLTVEGGKFFAMIDCRYPYGVTSASLTDTLRKSIPDMELKLPYDDPPTLSAPDDPFIQVLAEAYREAVGRPCVPGISGGVSYSKVFGHCVTFGTVGEGCESLAHQKNERISEAECVSALEIYYRTILKLAKG